MRLALANLYRPGSPTTTVVLSLGLGLSVLVAIALLETNLDAQIAHGLPSDAPSMFFIDIQPYQVKDFTDLVSPMPGVHKVLAASMIRGRITKINGVPAEQADVEPEQPLGDPRRTRTVAIGHPAREREVDGGGVVGAGP